ncbi:site-specific integrase [Sulfurimonas sp.]|uniref:site-specific integrase n=1 Tax=Sulfurimonas sp. TaxID=2022749 RepID=UPI00356AE265
METIPLHENIHQPINQLPDKVKTSVGILFNPNANIWKLNDISKNHSFNFTKLHLEENLLYGLKRTFIWYLENRSISHAANMFNLFEKLLNYIYRLDKKNISKIKLIDIKNFENSLDNLHIWHLSSLSNFLKKWYEMGYIGFSEKAYDYLNEKKLKGNKKGTAVLTMCPYKGPFTDLEYKSIEDSLNNKYANNEILEEEYLLIKLVMIYGSRPIQIAQLKVCDILKLTKEDASHEYMIRMPRAKNRKQIRSEFKVRSIPPQLGEILLEYTNKLKNHFHDILKDTEQTPLFPSQSNKLSGVLTYHKNSPDIRSKIKSIISKFDLISERTNKKLNIFPTRFRRTIGTRAASEGHGELIIAELLDHTDTQNVGVYVQSRPEMMERIDKAIALYFAPIAQAFAGKLVKDKSTAKRSHDPSADIIDPKVDSSCKAMGKCGTYSFCGLLSPIACYTCNSFQAWSDGPHEKVLESLLQERKKLLKTTDYRIASINDRTILAVAQVVIECKKYTNTNQQELIT